MKRIYVIPALLALIIGMTACGHSENEKKEQTTASQTTTSYQLATLTPHAISGSVQLPGVMQPFEFVQLYPKINGFVKDVYVDRGSIVRQGAMLITLEAPEIQEHVAAAKLKYTQAKAMYMTSKDKYERLLETSRTPGTISPYDLAAAKSKMDADSATTQGEYADYKSQLVMESYLTVTAPFDGVITERNVHPGALVGPAAANSKPMLILQQLSKLRLVVSIPEQYANQIDDGDVVHYTVNALPGQDFTGKVSRSAESLSNNYRSETIEIDVLNKNNDMFKPGMYAEVILPVTGNANALVAPKSAIVTTTDRNYVVVVDNNVAKKVDVTTGSQNGDSTEVYGDLHAGDQIVANPSYQIKDGQTIK